MTVFTLPFLPDVFVFRKRVFSRGLNNLKVHTVSDARYDEYFGFTDGDVDEILSFYGLASYKNVIREWYDGYLFGKVNVYCPWDVINYCDVLLTDNEAEPENYWANTSGNDLVRRLLKKADQTTRDEIGQLINGGSIIKSVRQELTYRDIEDSVDNVWSVLYSTGYLTQRGRLPGREVAQIDEAFLDLVQLAGRQLCGFSQQPLCGRFTRCICHSGYAKLSGDCQCASAVWKNR